MIDRLRPAHILLADQALVSGANFVVSVAVGRAVGGEGLGLFTMGWLTVFLAQNIHLSLVGQPLMSLLPGTDEAGRRAMLAHNAWINVFVSALCGLVVAVALLSARWWAPEWSLHRVAAPWAVVAFLGLIQDYARRRAFAESRPSEALLTDMARYLTQSVVIAGLALTGALTVPVAIVVVGGSALCGIVASWRQLWPGWDSMASAWEGFMINWRFGRWLLASAVLAWVGSNAFTFIAGTLLGATVVGGLRAAQQLVQPMAVGLMALENRIPVSAALAYREGGGEGLRAHLLSWIRRVLPALVVACIATAAGGSLLLDLVFGAEFAQYGHLVGYFFLVIVVRFALLLATAGLRATERTASIFTGHIAMSIFSALVAWPLIQHFGAVGAAVGPGLGYLVLAIWCVHTLRRATMETGSAGAEDTGPL